MKSIKCLRFFRSGYDAFATAMGCLITSLLSTLTLAQTSAFTYEGRLFHSTGTPVLESVSVKFQILNPAGTCVLYEEVQTGIDLTSTKGAFSLGVGTAVGDAKRSANFRGAFNPSMISVFRNGATLSGIPTADCATGVYAAGSGDARLLRVQVTKGSTTETLSPDLVINTVPSAQVATSLQGFLPSDFLRLDAANGISGHIGLTPVGTGAGQTREFRFYELVANGAEFSAFKAPDTLGTSLTYVLPSAAPAAGDILKATVPASGVVTLSWGADAGAGGGISNLNGSNQSSQSFTAVDIAAVVTAPAWSTNVGTGAHTLQIPMASGAGVTGGLITKTEHTAFSAKVDRAGDTMTGLLNFTGATGVSLAGTSGITFTGTGTIAMGTNKITGMADPTNAQEAATKAYVDSQDSGKISGTLTTTRVPFASGASTLTDDAALVWDNTNKRLGIGNAAPTQKLVVNGNIGATAFYTDAGNVHGLVNVAGGTALQSAGTAQIGVIGNGTQVQIANGLPLSFTSSGMNTPSDLFLYRDGVGLLALRNGTNAIGLRVYNTFSSATNYERGVFGWNTNVLTIGTEKGSGGGTAQALALQTDGTSRMSINAAGQVGIGTSNPTVALQVENNQNSVTSLHLLNSDTGNAGQENFVIGETVGAPYRGIAYSYYNSGFTAAGLFAPNTGILNTWAGATGGLGVGTLAAAPLFFYTGGNALANERMRVTSTGNVGIGTTTPSTKLQVAGEIKIGNTAVACSATTEGSMRYNSTSKEMEFCNATAWIPVMYAYSQPWLTLTPVSSTLNVTGPGTPAYSSYTTFTVQNIGNVDSGTITFTLTDTSYFEFGTNTCVGGGAVLSLNETCTIDVRAKAAIDTTYSGQLRVNVNNQPTANLSGTSTSTCGTAGDNYGGGKLVKCESGYALVATPGGCTNSTTPTCAGGVDSILKSFSSDTTNYRGALSALNGSVNTDVLVSYIANPPTYDGAQYCADMVYGGHSDWYLPASQEVTDLLSVSSAIGGFPAGGSVYYMTSTEVGAGTPMSYFYRQKNMDTGVLSGASSTKNTTAQIRCVRRH